MSSSTLQIGLSTVLGLLAVIVVYRVARRGLLNFQYAVGWLLLGISAVMAGIVLPLIAPIANFFAITPAALLAIGGVVLLVIICIQLSISISGLHERLRRLAEELAHLRQAIETTERDQIR